MPLTERQQLAYLLSMTAKENKADDSSEDILESKKVKKAKLSPVSSINRPKNKNGETQLHICTMKGELEIIKSMVKQGADVNCRDNANWTPLHEACNHGHYKIAKFLLKSGANVNAAGLDGDTSLHDASSNGHLKIVLLLLRHGADPHHKNDHGDSPIDVAEGEEVIEALQNFTKEMLKDLKPKKDYTPEKHRFKEDGEGNKKISLKSSTKSHKKTISNIDDFLETSSPIHSSKEVNKDGKRPFEKTHGSKTMPGNIDKGNLKSKKDPDRSYVEGDTSSMDSSARYLDGMKKQKLVSANKPIKVKDGFSTDHKSEKFPMKKSSESDAKHAAFNAERKRHHSESSVLATSSKKFKDGVPKGENKFEKHVDKRMDDSDDDMALSAYAGKDFKSENQHYNHPKKVRKHSLSLDSEVKEKYYVKDERDYDRKLSDFAKVKDPQLYKKPDAKLKDEMSPEKLNDLTKAQSKPNTSMQASSFMKLMKDSFGAIDRKPEKSLNKRPTDPRMKTPSESNRSTYSSVEPIRKKLSHSFSGSEYKSEKNSSKIEQVYKLSSSEMVDKSFSITDSKHINSVKKIEDGSPRKDMKTEKSIDKQSVHRERKLSVGSSIEDHKEIHRGYQVKKVKGGSINEYKSVALADHTIKFGSNDSEQVGKEKREKSPFLKNATNEGKFISSESGEKGSFVDSKEGTQSHVKKTESKMSLSEGKSESSDTKLEKSLTKKHEYLQKTKKTSDMSSKSYPGEMNRSKTPLYEQEDKISPEFHDASLIKKTYSKFDKSLIREHEKKLNSINQDLSKAIMRDHDKRVNIGNQDLLKLKHKSKHKMSMKHFLLKGEELQNENKSQINTNAGNDNDDVTLKAQKEPIKLKKEKQTNKEKNKKDFYESIESKSDIAKNKSNLSKYKNFLDDSDDDEKNKYIHHDDDKNKYQIVHKGDVMVTSSSTILEKKDHSSRSANESYKDKNITLKKETTDSYHRQSIFTYDEPFTSNKDNSEKLKSTTQQHSIKMESDYVEGNQKKKSANKEKSNRMHSNEYDISHSIDESCSLKKSEIDQISPLETHGDSTSDVTESSPKNSLKLNSSVGKEFVDKKTSTSVVEKSDYVSKVGHKTCHAFQTKGVEKSTSVERSSILIEGSEKHGSAAKTKSVDILLSDNRTVLEKEKRRKEKTKHKLKKSISLHESSDSTQKHSEMSKDKEKKYDAEKGHKPTCNRDILKVDKPIQDVSSVNKLKAKEVIQEHKSMPKVKHGKASQETDIGNKSQWDNLTHGMLSLPKTKAKELSHECKGHLKIKETNLNSEIGLCMVSPSKFKTKEDSDSNISSTRYSDSESNQETKSKTMEIREKHESLRQIPDIKLIETSNIDVKTSQKSKEFKTVSVVLPSKLKSKENEDSVHTVKYEDTESNEEFSSKTPELKEIQDPLDVAQVSMSKTKELDLKDPIEKCNESIIKSLSKESGKKIEMLTPDDESYGNEFVENHCEVKRSSEIKSVIDKKNDSEKIDFKEEVNHEINEKSLNESNISIEKDLLIAADEVGLGEFEKSHVDILDAFLGINEGCKYQMKKDIGSDSGITEMDIKSKSFPVLTDLDGASTSSIMNVTVLDKKMNESKTDVKCTPVSQSSILSQSDKSKKDGEVQESTLLPDMFDNEDKVIEEHILTCGPKLDKTSKHKVHNNIKREHTDGQNEAFRKKHKRKHSDESNTSLHHVCSKTKKTRSLDCDMQESKNSHLTTPLKEIKSFPVSAGDISPKKRHKHSKSSDGAECKYKVSSTEGSASTEVSPVKHPTDFDHISPKLVKHVSSKEDKSKSSGGMKNIDSTKIADSSLSNISPIKTEFKACVRAINAKDSDILHKAAKLKEVDLNMNLGLNDTALELVKKKKRKRHSESRDSNSDLRVLKVPTESISVENIPSPPEDIKTEENNLSKEVKLPHDSSNPSLLNKLPQSFTNKKFPEMSTNDAMSMEISNNDINLTSSNDNNLPHTSTNDIKLSQISTDEIKLPVISNNELKASISEIKVPEISSNDIKLSEVQSYEIKSLEIPTSEIKLEYSDNEMKVPEISTDDIKLSEASTIETKILETSTIEMKIPEICTSEIEISETTNHITLPESSTNETVLPETSNDIISSEISTNQNKLQDISINEAKLLESSTNDIELLEYSTSEINIPQVSLTDAILQKDSLLEEQLTENSSSEMELSEVMSSEEDLPEVPSKDLQLSVTLPTEMKTIVASLDESKMLKTTFAETKLSETSNKIELPMNISQNSSFDVKLTGNYSNKKIGDMLHDEAKISTPSLSNMVSTSVVSMDSHKMESMFNKETKQEEFSIKDDITICTKDNFPIHTTENSITDGLKFTDGLKNTDGLKVTEELKFQGQLEVNDGVKDTDSKPLQMIESSNTEKNIEYQCKDEKKEMFDNSLNEEHGLSPKGQLELISPADVAPLTEADKCIKVVSQELSLPDEVKSIPDIQKVDNSIVTTLESYEAIASDKQSDIITKQPISEQQRNDDERNEENENAVVNLLNMDREIDSMGGEDNVNNISSSLLILNSSSYIQKDTVNKEMDSYIDDNNDSFQDDSSQGSACSTLIDFDNTKTEDENLSNIFDQLNDITKSITQNQFNESVTQNHLPEEVCYTRDDGSKLNTIENKINTSIISLAPEITPVSDLTSVSNSPQDGSHDNLTAKHIDDCSSTKVSDYCTENIENIKVNHIDVISKTHCFETSVDNNKDIRASISYECVQKETGKEILNKALSTLEGSTGLTLKNDEFSELILPSTLTTSSSFGQRYNDLDSIDTSDLLKTEKVSCSSDILSNSSDSIILKKDLIDGQLGFSTNLSSDEIISKFADCILELDDTDNTYSLREYIPPPPMDCSDRQQEKQFISTISSVVSSINLENQCNNISSNENMVMNQFYPSSDSIYMPSAPPFNDHSAASAAPLTDSNSMAGLSQPLYVNTVNSVTTRLSTSDDKLYSPKHIFARGKIYSPKTSICSSSNNAGQSRRVSIEPCDMLRSIIESDVPAVPESTISSLPTIPEGIQEKEEEEGKEENYAILEPTAVKTETEVLVSQPDKPAPLLPPRLRNWREAIRMRCSKLSHAVNARDLDLSLRKVIREPKYKEVLEKASAYNLPQEMVMRHASEKERLRIHMVQEWCRTEQSVDLLSKEKGPISGMSVLYYQRDHISRKLGTTLDFKSKATIKPDYEKLRHARLTDLEDKLERIQQELEKRHQLEIEAHQKFEQLDTIFNQKNMLRQRYLRLRNKINI